MEQAGQAAPMEGKVTIVTGAALGIGFGVAEQVLAAGGELVLTDLDAEALDAAAEKLRARGHRVLPLVCDVRSTEDIETVTAKVVETFGRIDVLVNNAGIFFGGPIEEHTDEDWDRVFAVNMTGTFKFCRSVVPHMKAAGSGAIVNISSTAAFHFTTEHVAYAASKAAVSAFTRDLGYELAPSGIRVNAIAPGPIQTHMRTTLTPELQATLERVQVLGRPGDPHEIGDAVVFLASERSSYIIGVTLPVAGGTDLNIFAVG
jgi:NAD(P)-dependent dehydrogenase (short-subunit alcohol dehydrogenase family)